MFSFRIIIVAICALLVGLTGQNAFASGSGGYRSEDPDAGAMGMGSAFVGEADTPAAIYYNPAGINQISTIESSFGITTLAPIADFKSATTGNTSREQINTFIVPNFYAVVPIIPNKLTLGVDGGTYWGLGENWGLNSDLKYGITQASLRDIDNSLVAAYQVTDRWSVAASADHDNSHIDESKQFSNSTFGPDGGIELKGDSDSWGYRLATMFKINDQNQVGLMYRSRMNQTYTGKIAVNGISPALQGAYGFSGSTFVGDVEAKSVLPQSVVMGYSLKVMPKLTINADVEWMDWSSTKYQTIQYFDATPAQLSFLNTGNRTPEDWHSAWSESVGAQYDITDSARVRLGYYHHAKVIPSDNFTPTIPDSSSNGYTVGFGYDLTKRLTLDVAYSFAIYDSRVVTNPSLVAIGAAGKYSEYVNLGLASLTYKF